MEHCWKNSFDYEEIAVCVLEADHEGEHEFIPGDQVFISLAEPEEVENEQGE
jgi:hypothetical protein